MFMIHPKESKLCTAPNLVTVGLIPGKKNKKKQQKKLLICCDIGKSFALNHGILTL